MVKDAKLWREIKAQYVKLEEQEEDRSLVALIAPGGAHINHQQSGNQLAPVCTATSAPPASPFYEGGWQPKHWVLVCCALMVACEWLDRSVFSVSMQSIKEEFGLSDTETGLLASASGWIVPFAVSFVGRVADRLPRAHILGVGIFGWGASTFATGCAKSFVSVMLCRVVAGVSNCAGYPVAVSLLADYFETPEMTTAMGFFNTGMAVGGLLGFALGGTLVTTCGWRWAFIGVAIPQMVVSLLFFLTIREKRRERPPKTFWRDVTELMSMPTMRCLLWGSFLTGVVSGKDRFITAFIERVHGTDPATIGNVLGLTLGLTGLIAASAGGHVVDASYIQSRDPRTLLRLAAVADLLHLIFGFGAILAPNFGIMVLLSACSVIGSSLRQGESAAGQSLAIGRRATTQALMEVTWAVGMGIGPFATGTLSDSFESATCDAGCALTKSLLLCSIFLIARMFTWLAGASHLLEDLDKLAEEACSHTNGSASHNAAMEKEGSEMCSDTLPFAVKVGQSRGIDDTRSDGEITEQLEHIACNGTNSAPPSEEN